jgi:cold shock CspA family protein
MKSGDTFSGKVAFWNGNSYGFVRPAIGGEDLFFHINEVELPDGWEIRKGDRVTFSVANDRYKNGKMLATNVRFVLANNKPSDDGVAAPGMYAHRDEADSSALAAGLQKLLRDPKETKL